MLTLQIAYSNGEKGKCSFEKFPEDQGNDCCFYEPDCKITTRPDYEILTVWVSTKNYFPEIKNEIVISRYVLT